MRPACSLPAGWSICTWCAEDCCEQRRQRAPEFRRWPRKSRATAKIARKLQRISEFIGRITAISALIVLSTRIDQTFLKAFRLADRCWPAVGGNRTRGDCLCERFWTALLNEQLESDAGDMHTTAVAMQSGLAKILRSMGEDLAVIHTAP